MSWESKTFYRFLTVLLLFLFVLLSQFAAVAQPRQVALTDVTRPGIEYLQDHNYDPQLSDDYYRAAFGIDSNLARGAVFGGDVIDDRKSSPYPENPNFNVFAYYHDKNLKSFGNAGGAMAIGLARSGMFKDVDLGAAFGKSVPREAELFTGSKGPKLSGDSYVPGGKAIIKDGTVRLEHSIITKNGSIIPEGSIVTENGGAIKIATPAGHAITGRTGDLINSGQLTLPATNKVALDNNVTWDPKSFSNLDANGFPSFGGKNTYGKLDIEGQQYNIKNGQGQPGYSFKQNPDVKAGAVSHSHAEGHAAAIIRQTGVREGTLAINSPSGPCGYCNRIIENMLPQGSQSTVKWPGGVRTFTGNAK